MGSSQLRTLSLPSQAIDRASNSDTYLHSQPRCNNAACSATDVFPLLSNLPDFPWTSSSPSTNGLSWDEVHSTQADFKRTSKSLFMVRTIVTSPPSIPLPPLYSYGAIRMPTRVSRERIHFVNLLGVQIGRIRWRLPPFVEHGHSVPLNAVAVLDSLPIPSLVRACSPTHPSKRRNSSMGVVRGGGLGVKGSSFTLLDTNRVGRRRHLKSALLRLLKGS
eukprot:scaffold545_cov372-Pavlova_lutheri.AAC.20